MLKWVGEGKEEEMVEAEERLRTKFEVRRAPKSQRGIRMNERRGGELSRDGHAIVGISGSCRVSAYSRKCRDANENLINIDHV